MIYFSLAHQNILVKYILSRHALINSFDLLDYIYLNKWLLFDKCDDTVAEKQTWSITAGDTILNVGINGAILSN